MHVCSNLAEVVADRLKYILQLHLGSLPEEFLTEEVGDLVHHQLVESAVLLVEQLVEYIFHELAMLVWWLELKDFFVDLILQELEAAFILGKQLSFLDQKCGAFFCCLQILQVTEGLSEGQLEIVLILRSLLRRHRRVMR
jgi:hypothetical protein